ncbi:HAD-IIB family hydrolase [Aurantiacibacter gangjinensis]|uniref:sucrose-phosphate synthase n=1 Tax=Aurantiacibacter gangjinensis TaxID=502682 RepID=A0A0G9MJZ6_9SPHN|nr:HAD-IIB family hydrolase [Aurantiacibacter gangjinensis]APE29417.1 Sucrose phosphate synthase [Aurantiacibacter gangjinensis]KLE31022.1 hypothetical protein AAW01_12200 [Aurantiacibacter gangjinensis]
MHIMSIALGGCLRTEPVRYGITEDTGGHITYILGEMEALSRRDDVDFCEILTRRFDDALLGAVHSEEYEQVSEKLAIRRLDTGNRAYLAKEALLKDRPAFIQALLEDLRRRERLPDLIHAHFADAADVAAHVKREFGIPFIYTAHSLGMDKANCIERLPAQLEARIAEEDRAIGQAAQVVASSRDECERQLMKYPSARVDRITRITPGIDGSLPSSADKASAQGLLAPFLRDPSKPIILAVARPVRKKNLAALVEAYAIHADLREQCNLVILAGQRRDLTAGEEEQNDVLQQLIQRIDRHNLHGRVAYPKTHDHAQVNALYALAARSGGVFVNPALCEPFGLTLLEAAKHGLPVVATEVGGPVDIIEQLQHGLLVNPTDETAIGAAIAQLVLNPVLWREKSAAALDNIGAMSWDAYAQKLVQLAQSLPKRQAAPDRVRKMLVSDIDNTLTGCRIGARSVAQYFATHHDVALTVATGRSIIEARRLVREWGLPAPAAWITSVGTEIYVEKHGRLLRDSEYSARISVDWYPDEVERALACVSACSSQARYEQREFKRSYFLKDAALLPEIKRRLIAAGIDARIIFSHGELLDILPPYAGKGAAMDRVAELFGLSIGDLLAAGDSGNDADLLTACAQAILVANHAPEVASLADAAHIYVSEASHGVGVVEGLEHYRGLTNSPELEGVAA